MAENEHDAKLSQGRREGCETAGTGVAGPVGSASESARVQSPHDAFFKQVFGVPENAAAELRAVLPAAISARLDWATFERVDASFVDPDLSTSESDLVFSVRIGARRALVFILFEHQSTSDPMMGVRLLRYVVRIWERWARSEALGKLLPPVLPVVLHHSETGWTAAQRFSDLVDLDGEDRAALGRLVPDFEYVLDDVSHVSDAELMGRDLPSAAALALWALRDGRRMDADEFERAVQSWRNVLAAAADAPDGSEVLHSLFCYYSSVGEVSPERVSRALRDHVGGRAEEAFVTTADMLRQEGWARGSAAGEAKGKADALCAMLGARGFAVPDAMRQRIAECRDISMLDRWIVRAATAATVDEIFAGD